MHVRVLSEWSAAAPFRERWNELARGASVFQTYEWHEAWWQAFATTETLHVLVAFHSGEVVGIAPMVSHGGELRFIGTGNHASDYAQFLAADPAALDALLTWIAHNAWRWRHIDLYNIPSQSPQLSAITGVFAAHRLAFDSAPLIDCPTRLLGDPEADRAATNKKSLKRHFNHFSRSGTLEFRHVEDRAEIAAHLDTFFAQHIARRALTSDPSQFLREEQQRFYRNLAETMPLEWLRFAIVTHDERPIAYHFGFEFGRKFVWYKPAFDAELAKESPGEVLLKFLLEYAIGRKLSEFDFTVGSESFKYRFANVIRTNHRVRLFNARWRLWAFYLRRWVQALLNRPRREQMGAAS